MLITRFDYIEFYVSNLPTTQFLFKYGLGFKGCLSLNHAKNIDNNTCLISQNDINITLNSSRDSSSALSKEVALSGDFIKDVAFEVSNIDQIIDNANMFGAKIIEPVREFSYDYGIIKKATIASFGNTKHSLIQKTPFIGHASYLQKQLENSGYLEKIDHIAVAVEYKNLHKWIDFYEKVFGLNASSGSSMIQKLLKHSSDPSFISFALGFPSTDMLPSKNFDTITNQVLNNQVSLQYQPPSKDLKKIIVDLMAQKNINCGVDQVFLTSGAQQGLSLVSSLLLSDKKSYVLAEELVYSGFLQAIRPFNPGIITLSVNTEIGIDPLLLKKTIEKSIRINKKPSLIYLISEGHNPLGININPDNIRKIRDILEYYKIFAIEDDPYGFISYEEQNIKLKSLLPELTFYIGSFSKILAPSLRIGWIIAPKPQVEMLANIKEGVDLNISTFSQKLVAQYLAKYSFKEHITLVKEEYKRKRDTMVKHLNENFGDIMSFIIPSSGMFIWIEFKVQIDSDALLNAAIEQKIVYLPGNSFAIDQANSKFQNSIRLCFTLCSEAQIIDGLRKLRIAFDKIVGTY